MDVESLDVGKLCDHQNHVKLIILFRTEYSLHETRRSDVDVLLCVDGACRVTLGFTWLHTSTWLHLRC